MTRDCTPSADCDGAHTSRRPAQSAPDASRSYLDVDAPTLLDELESSKERYRALLESIPESVYVLDRSWRHVVVNEAACAYTRMPRGKLLGGRLQELFPGIEDTPVFAAFNRAMIDRTPERIEEQYEFADGRTVWYEITVYPVPEGILCVSRDITSWKSSEREVARGESRYRRLVENLEEGIGMVDPEETIKFVNPAFCRITGYPEQELIGRSLEDLMVAGAMEQIHRETERRKSGEASRYRCDIVRADGAIRTIDVHATPLQEDDGRFAGTLGLVTDVTDQLMLEQENERLRAAREEMERELVHAQKMESIGRLAGGVAHDFNNMLQAIIGNAALALAELPVGSELRSLVTDIDRAAHRSALLTRQLLSFASKETVVPTLLDLNEVVDELLSMLRRLVGSGIAVEFVHADSAPEVLIDQTQLEQLITNLVVNARDAIETNGVITIGVEIASCPKSMCPDGPPVIKPGVVLTVSDNGRGMDEQTRQCAFEPFFTTKEKGLGTGLGLSSVYGIARQNGGFVGIESSLGSGTTVRVYLPSGKEAQSSTRTAETPDTKPHIFPAQ